MTTKPKRKNDLIATFEKIERYHRRRSEFVLHAVASLAFQVALWGNWFASYQRYGIGFEGNFFADRFIISVLLAFFLIGHFTLMTIAESKDRLVMQALRQFEHEIEPDADSDEG